VTGSRWYDRLEFTIAALMLGTFVFYFGLHAFRYPWVGDIHRHSGSVASLYEDLLHPRHEAMTSAGSTSEVHTPYIVAVAGLGRMLAVSPYRALQIAGVLNLILYVAGVCVFFRTFSFVASSWIPPVAFLVVSLLMRERVFLWASETSLPTLRFIQAYPSMFGWGVALLVFAGTERHLATGSRRWLVVVPLLMAVLLLSHNLTAAWAALIVGVRCLMGLASGDRQIRSRSLWFGVAVAAGLGATWFWPYFDIAQSAGLRLYDEGSPFGEHPFRDMARLYLLAALAGTWLFWRKAHAFLGLGFLASFVALEAFRFVGYSYGNRFAFFQAFFAQALVAEGIALGLLLLWRQAHKLRDIPAGRSTRVVAPAFAIVAAIFAFTSPLVSSEARDGRPFLGWRALWLNPSSHDAYYASLGPLRERLSRDDVVLMRPDSLAFDIASITGARVVVSPFAYRVTDYPRRVDDVEKFLTPGTDRTIRAAILKRYHVSKVLLTQSSLSLVDELQTTGPVVASTPAFALLDVHR
jgi:hypothetical protein